jgi:hypothetical protein
VKQRDTACAFGSFFRAVFNGTLASSADKQMRESIQKLNEVTDEVRGRHKIHPAETIEEALRQLSGEE